MESKRTAEFSGTARFAILRRLGQGGMGTVYEALDRERQTRVALKTLSTLTAESLLMFKNEFRALQDIQHANLVRLGELFEEAGQWFFTMELVAGTDLLSYISNEYIRAHQSPNVPDISNDTNHCISNDTSTSKDTDKDADNNVDSNVETETARDPDTVTASGCALPLSAPPPHPDATGLTFTSDLLGPPVSTEPAASELPGDPAGAPASALPRAGCFDLQRLRSTLKQLVQGVAALHAAQKVHRDLKPSNITTKRETRRIVPRRGEVLAHHGLRCGTIGGVLREAAAAQPAGM